MFIEKRKSGKSIKYYLVHSYREKSKVKKIRKYLGKDLSKEELKNKKKEVKNHIEKLLEELKIKIFDFKLTKNQIKKLNKSSEGFKISHLRKIDWKKFEENFVYNTNAIEGSTVQLDEVKDILENKKVPKDMEELETKGVAKAIEYVRKTKEDLSLNLIKKLHKICFKDSKSFAGKFRDVEVVIRNSRGEVVHRGVSVKELRKSLDDLISWYKRNKNIFKPLVLAAIIHNQFEDIHPFQDGNGRVGRLLLNLILIKNDYPPINIELEDRREYYVTLNKYSQNNELKPTLKFLMKQYNKTLRKVTTKKKK
jgi:Fic family protein